MTSAAPGQVREALSAGLGEPPGRAAVAMSCTIEKILTDAKTLLERLREHDAAAESLVDQSAALHRRVAAMREAGTALPDQVGGEEGSGPSGSGLWTAGGRGPVPAPRRVWGAAGRTSAGSGLSSPP